MKTADRGDGSVRCRRRCCSLPWQAYALVAAAATACYVNGLAGEFVHDDIPAVVLNKDVLAVGTLRDLFANDFWGTPMADLSSHKSYRPLTILTFRMNRLVFGLNPLWFHATNVVLHAIATMLFTRVCIDIGHLRPVFATFAGLLFAVHPIHSEAVTGIVGRADVLASVFFLVSLLAYHGAPNGDHHLWLSILAGGLSMLAKETGITVFLVNLAYDIYKSWANIKHAIIHVQWSKETLQFTRRSSKIIMSFVILLIMRLALLQGSLPRFSQQDNPAAFHPSFLVRLLTYSYLVAFNWWLLLCPASLSHDWQMGSVPLVVAVSDARNLVTCLFFGLALALSFSCIFKKTKKTTMVLGLVLLIIPFLPATNLVVTVGFVIAERVLYIPSMGYILLTVNGVQNIWSSCVQHRQKVSAALLTILLAHSMRCVVRNKDWLSRESLLKAGLATLPHNAKMHYNYGNFLRDSARPELAKTYYHTALRLWPSYASAHNNLGTLISYEQDAEKHFLLAIRYSKEHLNAHYNLGQLYRKLNRTQESRVMLERCMKIAPTFTPAYIEMARLVGHIDGDIGNLLRRVVELNPDNPHYVTIYAHWLLKRANAKLALRYFLSSLGTFPSNLDAVTNAAKILRQFGAQSQLFQLITRYQSVQSIHHGKTSLHPHIYLQGWHLKFEIKNHSMGYNYEAKQLDVETVRKYTAGNIIIS